MKIEELNLSALKYFIDTVDYGSQTKAAEINFVTRPAVSQAIRRLEDWSGKKLITHEKKVFALTKEGQKFYQIGKNALALFKNSFDTNTFLSQSISMGCSASLTENFLIPSLKKFDHIENLSLKTGTSAQLKNLLLNREINLALYIDQYGIKTENNIMVYEGKYVIASGDSKMKRAIFVTEDRDEVMALKHQVIRNKANTLQFFCAESWGLCTRLALALNGACLIPDFLLNSELKKVKTEKFSYNYKVIATHRAPEFLSDAEKRIIETLRARAFN